MVDLPYMYTEIYQYELVWQICQIYSDNLRYTITNHHEFDFPHADSPLGISTPFVLHLISSASAGTLKGRSAGR